LSVHLFSFERARLFSSHLVLYRAFDLRRQINAWKNVYDWQNLIELNLEKLALRIYAVRRECLMERALQSICVFNLPGYRNAKRQRHTGSAIKLRNASRNAFSRGLSYFDEVGHGLVR
jgi:hypothetical protein